MVKFWIGMAGVLGGLAFSALYFAVGGAGIYAWGGAGWLIGATAAALLLRLMFPFPVGVFYFAWVVWDLHWALAASLALIGAALVAPRGSIMSALSRARDVCGDLFRSTGLRWRTPGARARYGTH